MNQSTKTQHELQKEANQLLLKKISEFKDAGDHSYEAYLKLDSEIIKYMVRYNPFNQTIYVPYTILLTVMKLLDPNFSYTYKVINESFLGAHGEAIRINGVNVEVTFNYAHFKQTTVLPLSVMAGKNFAAVVGDKLTTREINDTAGRALVKNIAWNIGLGLSCWTTPLVVSKDYSDYWITQVNLTFDLEGNRLDGQENITTTNTSGIMVNTQVMNQPVVQQPVVQQPVVSVAPQVIQQPIVGPAPAVPQKVASPAPAPIVVNTAVQPAAPAQPTPQATSQPTAGADYAAKIKNIVGQVIADASHPSRTSLINDIKLYNTAKGIAGSDWEKKIPTVVFEEFLVKNGIEIK